MKKALSLEEVLIILKANGFKKIRRELLNIQQLNYQKYSKKSFRNAINLIIVLIYQYRQVMKQLQQTKH